MFYLYLFIMKLKTIFLIGIFLSSLFACTDNKELIQTKALNQDLVFKVDSLQVQNDSLTKIMMEKDLELEGSDSPIWYYPANDSRFLEGEIENSEEYITNALRENLDLIPMKAVLGGTMHYNNIQLLGDKWLIADFEDGHVYGKAIFNYTINKKKEVEFKIIALSEN